MERAAPKEGDLRLARVRGRAVRDQHDLADEDDRLRDVRAGRVGAGGHDPVRGLQAACRGRGADPERFADDERPGLQGGRAGRDRRRLEARRGGEGQVALRRREQRLRLRRQALGARARWRSAGLPRTPRTRSTPSSLASPKCRRRIPSSTSARSARARTRRSQASFKDDLKRAGLFSIPLTLIILLVAFGALVAAGIPLLLGLTSVLATLGLVARHQPGAADVRLRLGDHPLDRARGRGRLHDVLLEARA